MLPSPSEFPQGDFKGVVRGTLNDPIVFGGHPSDEQLMSQVAALMLIITALAPLQERIERIVTQPTNATGTELLKEFGRKDQLRALLTLMDVIKRTHTKAAMRHPQAVKEDRDRAVSESLRRIGLDEINGQPPVA